MKALLLILVLVPCLSACKEKSLKEEKLEAALTAALDREAAARVAAVEREEAERVTALQIAEALKASALKRAAQEKKDMETATKGEFTPYKGFEPIKVK